MEIELNAEELMRLMEGLDYVKSKIAFTKGLSYADKTAQLANIEAIEQRLLEAKARS